MVPLVVRRAGAVMRNPLWIRPARGDDRTRIIRVIDCVAAEQRFLYTNRYEPTETWEQLLTRGLDVQKGLLLLLVEAAGKVVGFARLSRVDPGAPARAVGDIGIVLLPPYRSMGIGTSLLGLCIAAAPTFGFTRLRADMMEENVIARRLFGHFGFACTTPQRAYLPYRRIWIEQVTANLVLHGA